MDISDQIDEIVHSNGARISTMFQQAVGRVQIYKRAMNIWTCPLAEERALEALLEQALRQHLESRAEQTILADGFYAIAVCGGAHEGVEIQVMHPLADRQTLPESFASAQDMIDAAYSRDGRG